MYIYIYIYIYRLGAPGLVGPPPPDGMGPILQGSWTAGLAAARLVSRFVSRKQLRSSHSGFEAACRFNYTNSPHAVRLANTMVFLTFSNH